MDWADLDLMVHPLDREDRLVDMDPVLLVGSLDIEVDIDDIEDLVDSQDVADSPNMHDHHHMAAYREVDKAREAVDTPDDLGSLEDDSQDAQLDVLEADMVREVHFDVQVHQVYLAVMSVHLTLVIAGLKLGVLVELVEKIVMAVMEGVVLGTAVQVAGAGYVDFDEAILSSLILEGCYPHLS